MFATRKTEDKEELISESNLSHLSSFLLHFWHFVDSERRSAALMREHILLYTHARTRIHLSQSPAEDLFPTHNEGETWRQAARNRLPAAV